MAFEWDEAKNRINIDKHGISFEVAKAIFEGVTVDFVDDRNDYGEVRLISIGALSRIVVLTVTHTDRNGTIRMISARTALAQGKDTLRCRAMNEN